MYTCISSSSSTCCTFECKRRRLWHCQRSCLHWLYALHSVSTLVYISNIYHTCRLWHCQRSCLHWLYALHSVSTFKNISLVYISNIYHIWRLRHCQRSGLHWLYALHSVTVHRKVAMVYINNIHREIFSKNMTILSIFSKISYFQQRYRTFSRISRYFQQKYHDIYQREYHVDFFIIYLRL